MVAPGPNPQSDGEREELKVALVAVQESAAVQILLEACLPNEGDKAVSCTEHTEEILNSGDMLIHNKCNPNTGGNFV